MKELKRFLLAVAAVALMSASAFAQGTGTINLSVSATVSANCTISTSALAFGSYDPVSANASAALDGTGGVTVTCTNGAAAAITLGQGTNGGGRLTEPFHGRRSRYGQNESQLISNCLLAPTGDCLRRVRVRGFIKRQPSTNRADGCTAERARTDCQPVGRTDDNPSACCFLAIRQQQERLFTHGPCL